MESVTRGRIGRSIGGGAVVVELRIYGRYSVSPVDATRMSSDETLCGTIRVVSACSHSTPYRISSPFHL